jgi:O-antigen/teichoic acid export membrane protein
VAASAASFFLLGRYLGAAGYGAFVGLYALIGPFLAVGQAGLLLTAMEHTAHGRESPNAVMRSCLSLTLIYGACLVPAMAGIAAWSIGGIAFSTIVLLIGTEFLLRTILRTAAALIQVVKGYSFAARLRTANEIVKILLVAGLTSLDALTLPIYAVGQALTLSAITAFALVHVARLGVTVWPGRIHGGHVRSMTLYGVGIAAATAQKDTDKFVLNAAQFPADAGRYGAAYQLLSLTMLPLTALASLTHVSFLNTRDGSGVQIQRALRLSLVALVYAVPVVIALEAVAPWILGRLLPPDFAEVSVILQLLAPVVILRGIGGYPMNGLMGLGRNQLRTKLLVVNALVSLALYIALIPTYSWRGAVVATLVSESLFFAAAWVALVRCERRGSATGAASGVLSVLRGGRV